VVYNGIDTAVYRGQEETRQNRHGNHSR
jgi:hypothetical protein